MTRKARHWHRFGFDHPYDNLIRQTVAARTTKNSATLAALEWDVIELALAASEPWALKIIEPIFKDVMTRDNSAQMRYQDGTARVYISKMDETRDIPLNVGIQPYMADGSRANYSQRELFIELPRAEWLALLLRQQSVTDTASGTLAAMMSYEQVWQQHPTALTAHEACVMAGIDPFEFLPPNQQTGRVDP